MRKFSFLIIIFILADILLNVKQTFLFVTSDNQENLCCSSVPSFGNLLYAKSFFENSKGENILELDKNWKFKTGDNLDYAKPDFDDEKWEI